MIHEGPPPAAEQTPELAIQLTAETERALTAAIEQQVHQLLTNFEQFNAATAETTLAVESEHTIICGKSIKKETATPRANEDVIAAEKDWAMLADGTSGQKKNVSMLLGYALAETAKNLVPKIIEHHQDNLDQTERHLAAIPLIAKELLTNILAQPSYAAIMQDRKITALDFSTTLDLAVILPNPQLPLRTVIIVHHGDSRVYLDTPKQPLALQVTQDDKLTSTNRHTLSLQTNTAPSIQRMQCSPGDKLAILGDGTYTMRTGIESITAKLHHLLSQPNSTAAVDHILQAAENMKGKDDRSVIVIELQ